MELKHGPYTYEWQQEGILVNVRKREPATPRERRRPSGCKVLFTGKRKDGTGRISLG